MSTRLAMAGKNNVYTAGQNFNGTKIRQHQNIFNASVS